MAPTASRCGAFRLCPQPAVRERTYITRGRMNETLLKALGAAMVAFWLHGVWEYIQMVRHRKPGTSPFSVSWAPDRLTDEGLRHRRRVLLSWASIAVLLVAALLVGVT